MSFLRAVSGNQAKAIEANKTDSMAKTDRNGIMTCTFVILKRCKSFT